MNFRSKYDIGEIVYIKTDPDQKKRMVVQVCFGGTGKIEYHLRCGADSVWCFEMEMSLDKDYTITTSE